MVQALRTIEGFDDTIPEPRSKDPVAYEFGPFRLNVTDRSLMRNGELLTLSTKPFQILVHLIANGGLLVTKDELMQKIWADLPVEESNLTVSMSKIRKVLGERRRYSYIVTVPHYGYRFIAKVRRVGEDRVDSIAVLPFINEKQGRNNDYLSDYLTESLIFGLSNFANVRVASCASVFPYKGKHVSPHKVADKLGVVSVLAGRISRHGKAVIISTELLDARNNELIWGNRYVCRPSELLAVHSEIIRVIVENLQCKSKILGLDDTINRTVPLDGPRPFHLA